jgi:hypothetical protein
MGTQAQLKFGNTVLCNPSNGHDGYRAPGHDNPLVDGSETSIPGTAGRIKIVTGAGASDQSSYKLEFECEHYENSAAALDSWKKQLKRAGLDAANNLRTVYYGYLNDGGTYTEVNCDMRIRFGEQGETADGYWWQRFSATFNQFGE